MPTIADVLQSGSLAYAQPSPASVAARRAIAQQLMQSQVQNAGPFGALANTLGGFGSGYMTKSAADEERTGTEAANKALAEALKGGGSMESLSGALGNGFMNSGQQGLINALLGREVDQMYPQVTAAQSDYLFGQQHPDFAATPSGGDPTYSQTPVFLQDPEGRQYPGQMSSGGGILVNGKTLPTIPEGWQIVARPENMRTVDTGGGISAFDPNSGALNPLVPKQGAPSANMDVVNNPDGTRTMAPAQGSPEAIQRTGDRVAAEGALASLERKNTLVANTIDQALNNANFWTAGVVGQLASAVPGTPAYDLARTLDTIKANIGFNELQSMRDNSPTGGALGAISERELAFLQSTITNIEQAQSEPQLRSNLEILKNYLQMSQTDRRSAFNKQFGGGQAQPAQNAPAAPAAPASGGFQILSVEP